MYIFKNEHQIEKYNSNEVLKFYRDNTLIKTIANASPEILKFLGYKELVEEPIPEEKEGYYIEEYYEDGEVITRKYRYVEIVETVEEVQDEQEWNQQV